MSEWQPIETAPKDEEILAWFPSPHGSVERARWDSDKYANKPHPHWSSYGWLWGRRALKENQPTHWMPLPAPPVPQQPKE